MKDRVKKSKNCIGCGLLFGDGVKWVAKDFCMKCYNKNYNLKNKVEKPPNCKGCGLIWGSINRRGNIVKRATTIFCSSCYPRIKDQSNKCLKCGDIIRAIHEMCKQCKMEDQPKYGVTKANDQMRMNRETYESVRRLLSRFKVGSQTPIDHWIVLDLYLSLFGYDVYLDQYAEADQVYKMLRKLKNTWEWNKDNIYHY